MARNPVGQASVKSIFIKDLQPGQRVRDLFAVCAAKSGNSRNGPYWGLTLQDRTGRLEAKIWSPHSLSHPHIPPGCLAVAEGQTGLYRDQLQMVIERFENILRQKLRRNVYLCGHIRRCACIHGKRNLLLPVLPR